MFPITSSESESSSTWQLPHITEIHMLMLAKEFAEEFKTHGVFFRGALVIDPHPEAWIHLLYSQSQVRHEPGVSEQEFLRLVSPC